MGLCYRGVKYSQTKDEQLPLHPLEVTQGEIIGKYRGLPWQWRQSEPPMVRHFPRPLHYRGAKYYSPKTVKKVG